MDSENITVVVPSGTLERLERMWREKMKNKSHDGGLEVSIITQ